MDFFSKHVINYLPKVLILLPLFRDKGGPSCILGHCRMCQPLLFGYNTTPLFTFTNVMNKSQSISESKIGCDILTPKPQAIEGVAVHRIFVLC